MLITLSKKIMDWKHGTVYLTIFARILQMQSSITIVPCHRSLSLHHLKLIQTCLKTTFCDIVRLSLYVFSLCPRTPSPLSRCRLQTLEMLTLAQDRLLLYTAWLSCLPKSLPQGFFPSLHIEKYLVQTILFLKKCLACHVLRKCIQCFFAAFKHSINFVITYETETFCCILTIYVCGQQPNYYYTLIQLMDNLMTKCTKSYICMDVEGSCKWFNGQMMAELSFRFLSPSHCCWWTKSLVSSRFKASDLSALIHQATNLLC